MAWTTKLKIFTIWPLIENVCRLWPPKRKTHVVGGDYLSTWAWVLVPYHRNISQEFFSFEIIAFQLTEEKKKKICAKREIPAPFSYHFSFYFSLHRFTIFAWRRGTIGGRCLAKLEKSEHTLVFPPPLISCLALPCPALPSVLLLLSWHVLDHSQIPPLFGSALNFHWSLN